MDTVLIAEADERVRAFLADNLLADAYAVFDAAELSRERP